MRLREVVLNVGTALAVACAVGTVALRITGAAALGAAAPAASVAAPVSDATWAEVRRGGLRSGPANTRVELVEFGDFECPSCSAYAPVLHAFRQRYPEDVAIIFRQLPLPYHRLAYPLARGAVCADEQGRFTEYHDAVFAGHDSLGLLPLVSYGLRAGVRDSAAFAACIAASDSVPQISRDVELARQVGVPGTPAVLVDRKLHSSDLTADLTQLVDAARKGAAGARPLP